MPAQYPGNATTKAARAKAGGGFESAIEVVSGTPAISSVTDNGDGTLTISGSGFGSKTQAAPLLHDIGGNAWENGVLNTFYADQPDGTQPAIDLTYPNDNAPYRTFSADANDTAAIDKSQAFRHAGQSANYLFYGSKARLGTPAVYTSGSNSETKLYFAAWVKYKWFWFLQPCRETDLTGPLTIGEPVTVNGQDIQATYTGYRSDQDFHYIEVLSRTDIEVGDVVAGVDSGESFTVSHRVNPGGKISRIRSHYNDGSVDSENFRASDSDDSWYVNVADASQNTVRADLLPTDNQTDWSLLEYEIEYFPSLQEAIWIKTFNGRVLGDPDNRFILTRGDVYGITVSLFGLDNSGRGASQEMLVGEVYQDASRQRVYLGNASTWSAVTHRELQRPTSWATDNVTVSKNEGTLTGSKWVYVAGSNGDINETGVQV